MAINHKALFNQHVLYYSRLHESAIQKSIEAGTNRVHYGDERTDEHPAVICLNADSKIVPVTLIGLNNPESGPFVQKLTESFPDYRSLGNSSEPYIIAYQSGLITLQGMEIAQARGIEPT